MTAPPMTGQAAAWIRAHAWTPAMRRTFADTPGYFLACPCQYGVTDCRHGDQCHRRDPLVRPIGSVLQRGGEYAAVHPEPYEYPTPTATVPQRTAHAQVWHADRACRWVCNCACHTEPAQPKPARPPRHPRPAPRDQDALFPIGATA